MDANFLRQLRKSVKSNRLGKLMKRVLVCMTGFEVIEHPAYSPDLVQSVWLSSAPQQEKHLAENQYRSDDDGAMCAVVEFGVKQNENLFTSVIQALQHWWKYCVDK